MNRKCPLGTQFYNFQPLHQCYPLKLLTSWTTGAIWQINSNHNTNKRTTNVSMSGTDIVSILHGYSTQLYMISLFSGTAGLFVIIGRSSSSSNCSSIVIIAISYINQALQKARNIESVESSTLNVTLLSTTALKLTILNKLFGCTIDIITN